MTTRFMDTTAIPLYRMNDETYCRMIDVMKLIHHESYETENDDFKRILDRMEMRVCKNDFLFSQDKVQDMTCPCRYIVGREEDGRWKFFVRSKDGDDTFSDRPCKAKRYLNYRDARACADFLDGEWDVIDMYDSMTEEERWVRELRLPMPFDADDGNEEAIMAQIVM